jgi:hypothetical protein
MTSSLSDDKGKGGPVITTPAGRWSPLGGSGRAIGGARWLIFQKLDARSRTEAILRARQRGLVRTDRSGTDDA